MYKQRLNIFILLSVLCIIVCGVRLAQLQLFNSQRFRDLIEQEGLRAPAQLPTIRGSIIDRNGKYIAVDKPAFFLGIKYQLTCLLDDRYWRWRILERANSKNISQEQAEIELRSELGDDYLKLIEIIDKLSQNKEVSVSAIEEKVRSINDHIWRMREFFAWLKEFPNSEIRKKYKSMGEPIPASIALADFKAKVPDADERILLANKTDLREMYQTHLLVELENEKELLEAQLAFVNIEGVEISPKGKRYYPYNSAAAQLIGWVGNAQESENELFDDDTYSHYLSDDIAGKGGVERVCEVFLRGRRGEVIYDRDGNMVEQLGRDSQFGQDVVVSIDIELQQKIEEKLSDPEVTTKPAIGAVVLDVATNDILALVSMPVYDLNSVRQNYNKIFKMAGNPFGNKALYETYPPGSTVKPVILIAGLEEKKISEGEVISCPPRSAPKGWPNCITFRKFHTCHDYKWDNNARNAIRGSCNVYFSHLAHRVDSKALQKWLFNFGYGRKILSKPNVEELLPFQREKGIDRNLRQSGGQISSAIPSRDAVKFEDITKLETYEKRMFGIGQGGMRATALQVANAIAAISRGGIYKSPRLFLSDVDVFNEEQRDLGISENTLRIVRDGMRAVASEVDGTAYSVFKDSVLNEREVKVYGKTGSTEKPEHAWFAGFAEDSAGRAISIAVVVETGESGSRDAAPLGHEILKLCNEAGYIGTMPKEEPPTAAEDM
ncbi:MAG: hypothetical protein JW912_01320 [Sedimentisphaerales bacterium]|nr:hypothetical protein [Sedimentisphaerales bacterium]